MGQTEPNPDAEARCREELMTRFGSTEYFEDAFTRTNRTSLQQDFDKFNNEFGHKKFVDDYEFARQRFLKLVSQEWVLWQPTNPEFDMNCEVARIYREERHQFLAYMRLHPQGFRADRAVPAGVEIVFHLLIGRVSFTIKNRERLVTKGQRVAIPSRSVYSIRCRSDDQPSIMIFRIIDHNRKQQSSNSGNSENTHTQSR